MIQTIEQAGELQGKTVFMRADFDVPVVDGKILEPFRIEKQKETLHYLLDHGAKVILAAHISMVPSFEPLKPQLEQLLDVTFGDQVTLLENTRQDPGEQTNDEAFARELVAGCDLYVNNAFAVCHRAHASVAAAAKLLPAYAGFLIKEETEQLAKVIDAPAQGKVVFMGGAKANTKIPVIRHLIEKADVIAVGGVVANDILAGTTGVDMKNPKLRVPTDFVMDNGHALDIGPETAKAFVALAGSAKCIIWNGPMGKFEDQRFMAGTQALARVIANSSAWTAIGGGDTIAAVNQLGLLDRFKFVSTGGGAMLAFLAGQRLPGFEALGYYD